MRFSFISRALIVCASSIRGVWKEELLRFADYPYGITLLKGTVAKKKEQLNNVRIRTSDHGLQAGESRDLRQILLRLTNEVDEEFHLPRDGG